MESTDTRLALLEQKMNAHSDILLRHDGKLDAILECVTDIKVAHGKLEVRAGIWGALAGLIPAALFSMKSFIQGKS